MSARIQTQLTSCGVSTPQLWNGTAGKRSDGKLSRFVWGEGSETHTAQAVKVRAAPTPLIPGEESRSGLSRGNQADMASYKLGVLGSISTPMLSSWLQEAIERLSVNECPINPNEGVGRKTNACAATIGCRTKIRCIALESRIQFIHHE